VRVRAGAKIFVELRLDESTYLRFKDQYLNFKEISKRPEPPRPVARPDPKENTKPSVPYRPPLNHAWRNYPTGRSQALFETSRA
jgi:hypothetical protein